MCNYLNPHGFEYQAGAHVSATRLQVALSIIPVLGLILVTSGCVVAGHRAFRKHKDREWAKMEQGMKPPLPESQTGIWIRENGREVMKAFAVGLSVFLAAKRREGNTQCPN